MAPTPRLRSLAVVPPPPSYDPSSYEPFDDEVNRTIDQILNEEASFESSKDEDWPIYSGGDSSSASSRPTPHCDKDVKESRFFSQPPTSNSTKLKGGKRKPVAKRNITVIDLESDSEDDVAPINTNGQEPKEATDEVPDVGNEADNESPMDNQPQNEVDVPMDMWNPLSQGVDGVVEPTISDDATDAEEDAIFASVDLSQRSHLLHYLVSHPFMQNSVQPVARSARRSFVHEMRREATTAGMDETAADRLIEYVRKVYLEDLGVDSNPLPEGLNETPFGEEIEDDHLEDARRRKSHKRELDSGERTDSKKKKRKKGDKKHSKEMPGPSLQSALRQEVSERVQATESSPRDDKRQDDEKDAAIPGAGGARQNSDTGSKGHDSLKITRNGDQALQDAIEQMIQHEKSAALDTQHADDTNVAANGNAVSLEKQPTREPGQPVQQTNNPSPEPEKSIVAESSHSEPDLPPNHAQLRRGSTDKENKKVRKEDPLKASKARRTSRSIEIHADENAISENQPSIPSKPETVPKAVHEAPITKLEANQNGHREERERNVKESSKEDKENGAQDASADIVPESPLAKTKQEMKAVPVEKESKKSANWRKKERKKKKKRHSHLEIQDKPQTDDQAPEPQPMPQPSVPVSIPDPVTPKKSSKKSRSSDLSPNPAEWDLDF